MPHSSCNYCGKDIKKIKKQIKVITELICKLNEMIHDHTSNHPSGGNSEIDISNPDVLLLLNQLIRQEVSNQFIVIEQRLNDLEELMKGYTKRIVQTSMNHVNIRNPVDKHACGGCG